MIAESSTNQPPSDDLKPKKRRLHGACDACRRKKVKCDSAKMPEKVCTNCRVGGVLCGHTMVRHTKKKDSQTNYIRNLEQRLERMERSLHDIRPENDPSEASSPSVDGASVPSPPSYQSRYVTPKTITTKLELQSSPPSASSDNTSEAEDLSHVALAEQMKRLSIANLEERYYGQSSGFMFLQQTLAIRSEITGSSRQLNGNKFRRPVYWEVRPWELELAFSNQPTYIYPDDDLVESLTTVFFEKVNVIYPILHQPSFRKALLEKRHIWDPAFGMTVLLVCAISSRHSDDPRVVLPGENSKLSSGWQWFSQVPVHRNPLFEKSTIYDMQYFVLASLYLIFTSVPHAAWTILGLGMRIAQEKGIHRRNGHNQKPTVDGELMKRAFWCLVALDRVKSSFLGRPCLIQDEDFDVDYPIECDDQYWENEDPQQAFKQPPGKPSKITAFVCQLKLSEILVYTLRTLYATKKSKVLSGYAGEEWERRIVAELDSSMNKWKDTLPQFLHWNAEKPNYQDSFFNQSANLHALYYYAQILIHRPFLVKKSPLSYPSLAICTNAARSASKVVETGLVNLCAPYSLMISAFSSGIVISLNLLGHLKSGSTVQPVIELDNLQRCLGLLRECEKKSHIAGRFRDMLETISTIDYPPVANSQAQTAPEFVMSCPRSMPQQEQPQPRFADLFPSFPAGPLSDINTPTPPNITAVHTPVDQANTNPVGYNSSETFPPTNWDLNNLLLLQMAYSRTNLGDNMDVYSDNNHTYMAGGMFAPEANMLEDMNIKRPNATLATGPGSAAEETFSLWSTVPGVFSVDEWDNYISNMDTTNQQRPG